MKDVKPHQIDKIRKLLELARSAEGTAEGTSAREKAMHRMEELNLTEDEVLSDRKVAMQKKAQIWEQALMELVAELSFCGLQVDRATNEWILTGSRASTSEAANRFEGISRQLYGEGASYISNVREGMRNADDDPSTARSILERMRRVFLEAASIAVSTRLLERLLTREKEREALKDPSDIEIPTDEPSRKKRPFEKLVDRFELGGDMDWDIEVEGNVADPSTAGNEAGGRVDLDPPKVMEGRQLESSS